MDVRFSHPSSFVIAGPSCSGEMFFVRRVLQYLQKLFTRISQRIVWLYGEHQSFFREYPNVEFEEGSSYLERFTPGPPTLILDDLLFETNDRVAQLFAKGCHHKNASVMHLTQNRFHQSKQQRTISLSAHYLSKNLRDSSQIQYLARQMFPQRSKVLLEAYRDATLGSHGYLLIDLHRDTPEHLRLRTIIFSVWNTNCLRAKDLKGLIIRSNFISLRWHGCKYRKTQTLCTFRQKAILTFEKLQARIGSLTVRNCR